MAIDHHAKPFDEGTRKKLDIYKAFLQAWIQVFLNTSAFAGQPLSFFDFFSGPGQDQQGVLGSPLILMDELQSHRDLILSSKRPISILFNDKSKEKIARLREICSARNYSWTPQFESLDFAESFAAHKSEIGSSPSFVFLDQNGVKFVTRDIFTHLTGCSRTDILFFFASSHQRRFSEEFANELHIAADTPHWDVHRRVADAYRGWAPKGYFVGQYSIMKGSNIYGLVFGSSHWLGMYKFLRADPDEANYEIDAPALQGDFFAGHKMTKVEALAIELEKLIRGRILETDGDVVLHSISQGVLPSKVAPELYRKLKEEGVLAHSGTNRPRASEDALRSPRPLVFA
jgi:three-Cys-motif partner protein